MTTRRAWPDVAIPPGETLAEEMAARALSQKALALKMGRPVQVVNEIVLGKKQIVARTALDLEAALKIPAEFWMNLERSIDRRDTPGRLRSPPLRRTVW